MPDFYIEMKWQFTSWSKCSASMHLNVSNITNSTIQFTVPGLARFCPNDTYKVYKHGGNVRIDTTLLDIDDSGLFPKSIKGKRSYLFICNGECSFIVADYKT